MKDAIIYDYDDELETRGDIDEDKIDIRDALGERLAVQNIEEDINDKFKTDRNNFVAAYRKNVEEIFSTDPVIKNATYESIANVCYLVLESLNDDLGVRIGTDPENILPRDLLTKVEHIYEFFYVRNMKNITDLFRTQIMRRKDELADRYKIILTSKEYDKDIFFVQMKKKFANQSDAIILFFMFDIINDLVDEYDSAYDLYMDITRVDEYEETNSVIGDMLINYGSELVIENDLESAQKFFNIIKLDNQNLTDLRNELVAFFSQEAELDSKYI